MSLPVILRPEVQADIQDTHHQLEQSRTGLGRQFAARVRGVLERIEAMPELYGVVWQDVRAARLKRFRYPVYDVVLADPDLARQGIRLRAGLPLTLQDEELEADGEVHFSPEEQVWVASIDWGMVRQKPA
jgi:hypothetical protein